MARGGARNDMGVGGPGGFRMMGGLNGGPRGGRHAGFDGTVSSVSGNSVTITAANGTSVTVTLPAASTVLTQHTGSVQDLTTGSTVHVDLVPGTTDQATSVIVTK
jgi:preprotein translocase subunit YajC